MSVHCGLRAHMKLNRMHSPDAPHRKCISRIIILHVALFNLFLGDYIIIYLPGA
jgi:hypothetical protein